MSTESVGVQVASEQDPGGTSKTYDYTPAGARLSQHTAGGSGPAGYGYYSYNGHADVEAATGANGTTTATYGYTAYGSPVTSMFTGADKNDATASSSSTTQPDSAYRFNAMRWDGTSGSYDMGFRTYDPGINQFASRDMYDGATQDMGLTADPFTGSRYAFGNGNPISNIENDGHTACAGPGTSDCGVQGGPQMAPPASTSCPGPVLSCGGTSLFNVPAGSGSCGGCTSPGSGKYYKNDTPIAIPPELPEDHRPYASTGFFGDLLHSQSDRDTYVEMEGVQTVLRLWHDNLAASLLGHWLDNTGAPVQLSPQDIKGLMNVDPTFQNKVTSLIGSGSFDSGWRKGSVGGDTNNHMNNAQRGYWYALNGYQYRVFGSEVNGSEQVSADLFKRYNWGNPAGGAPRGDLPIPDTGDTLAIRQDDVASLNADGLAEDFNVWGTYSFTTAAG